MTNPDQVASNDQIAWATAFWFWKQNVIGGQYGSQVLNGQFGAATNAIKSSAKKILSIPACFFTSLILYNFSDYKLYK